MAQRPPCWTVDSVDPSLSGVTQQTMLLYNAGRVVGDRCSIMLKLSSDIHIRKKRKRKKKKKKIRTGRSPLFSFPNTKSCCGNPAGNTAAQCDCFDLSSPHCFVCVFSIKILSLKKKRKKRNCMGKVLQLN